MNFTTNLTPQCRAFSEALKTEKLSAPLFTSPRGPWIQMTGALLESTRIVKANFHIGNQRERESWKTNSLNTTLAADCVHKALI